MSRAGIRKVTATNHAFRIPVRERANRSMNEWDLMERALEKGSVRLDVVGVDVSFHSSTSARWEADRKKPPLTRHSDWFTRSKYKDTRQANVVLNYSPNSWASEGCANCRRLTANSRTCVYDSTNRYLSLNRKESRFCFSSYFKIGLRGEALRSI
jgi:hypothetical protein